MVAVLVMLEVIKCQGCDKPIARRYGERLVYESNRAHIGFVGRGVVTIQCPHNYEQRGQFIPCRTNNEVIM